MREGWTYKKLGEVCEIICGQDYKNVESPDGKYPIYGTGGIMGYANQFRCPAYSIIVGRKGSINNPIYVEENFWNVDTAFGIVPSKASLSSKFFFYFCKKYDFTKHNVAVTIPSLRRIDLLKIPIPVPPLSEQQRIVSELDLLSSIIEKKKAQLKEYDKLAQSIFYDMFGDPVENPKGWEVKKLGEVCTFTQGIQVPIEEQRLVKEEGDILFLRIIDFTQGKEQPRFVKCPNERYILHEREIAIVRYGTPGFVCYGIIGAIANNLFKITPNQKDTFNYFFLIHWLNSDAFQSSVKDRQYGAALKAIKFSTIQNINIYIPQIIIQQQFAEKIESIEKQKSLIQQSITEVQMLFDSRMDKWFG